MARFCYKIWDKIPGMYFIQANHMCTYHTISYCICISCNIAHSVSHMCICTLQYTHTSLYSTPVSHGSLPLNQNKNQHHIWWWNIRIDYFKHNSIYFWLCRVRCCAGFPPVVASGKLLASHCSGSPVAEHGLWDAWALQLQFPGPECGLSSGGAGA